MIDPSIDRYYNLFTLSLKTASRAINNSTSKNLMVINVISAYCNPIIMIILINLILAYWIGIHKRRPEVLSWKIKTHFFLNRYYCYYRHLNLIEYRMFLANIIKIDERKKYFKLRNQPCLIPVLFKP